MSRLDGEYDRLMKIQSSHTIFHRCTRALIFLLIGLLAQPAFAVTTTTPEEMANAQAWWAKYLGAESAFRRPESAYESARFKLHGLEASATYAVENFDGGTETVTGKELMEHGLAVTAATAPTALIFTYKRAN